MNSLHLTAAILLLIAVQIEGQNERSYGKRLLRTEEVVNECTITVRCERIYGRWAWLSGCNSDLTCVIQLNVQLSERDCRIIFTESSNTNVTRLEIQGELEALPDLSDVVKTFENLIALDISETKLKTVDRADLKNLSEFRLNRNQLKVLPEGLFRNNRKLEKIWLDNNKIKEIHRDLFKELGNLKKLYLDENQLEILPEGLFRNNQKLFVINLYNNNIKTIETDFQNLPNLVFLDLRRNICIDDECNVEKFCGTNSRSEMQQKFLTKCPK